MRTFAKIVGVTLILALFTSGAIYQNPEIFFSDSLAAEVNYQKIFLNEHSELTELTGAVFLNGVPARDGAILKTGDKIATSSGSSATLLYFEDSLTRLEENTHYQILALESDPENPLETKIRGRVETGRAWSKVIRPLDPNSIFAVGSNTTVATIRGSAFAVEVKDGETIAYSSEHGLALTITNPLTGQELSNVEVAEGEEAIINDEAVAQSRRPIARLRPRELENKVINKPLPSFVQKTVIPESVKNAAWFRANERHDEAHIQKVERKIEEQKRKVVSTQNNSPFYFLKERIEARELERAKTPEERVTTEAKQLKRTLLEKEVAHADAEEIKTIVKKLTTLAVAQNQTSPEGAQNLKADLALLEKDYALARPTDEHYEIKTQLLETRVIVSQDAKEKKRLRERALHVEKLDLTDTLKNNPENEEVAEKLEAIETREETLKVEKEKLITDDSTTQKKEEETSTINPTIPNLVPLMHEFKPIEQAHSSEKSEEKREEKREEKYKKSAPKNHFQENEETTTPILEEKSDSQKISESVPVKNSDPINDSTTQNYSTKKLESLLDAVNDDAYERVIPMSEESVDSSSKAVEQETQAQTPPRSEEDTPARAEKSRTHSKIETIKSVLSPTSVEQEIERKNEEVENPERRSTEPVRKRSRRFKDL